MTSRLGHGVARGSEIQQWLDGHPEVRDFVIIDDGNDMLHLTPNLVLTDARNGFQYTDMLACCDVLGIENKTVHL